MLKLGIVKDSFFYLDAVYLFKPDGFHIGKAISLAKNSPYLIYDAPPSHMGSHLQLKPINEKQYKLYEAKIKLLFKRYKKYLKEKNEKT